MKKYLFLSTIILLAGFFFFQFNSHKAKAANCLIPCQAGNEGKECCKKDAAGDLVQGTCFEYGNIYNCTTGETDKCGGKCTNTEECSEMEDNSWECTLKENSDKCGGKCTNTEECSEMEDNSWECTPKENSGNKPSGGTTFSNPLKYDTVEGLATNLLSTLRTIIVVLSIIFIVLGGVFYIISAGNEKMMTMAKGSITASMIGLAIGIAAPSFLKEIYTIMGGTGGITPPAGLSLSQIATNFLNFLLAIIGILALIMLIIGGITFLTSAGDEDRYKTGKKIVTYAIIGIAVSLAALVIVKQISSLLMK